MEHQDHGDLVLLLEVEVRQGRVVVHAVVYVWPDKLCFLTKSARQRGEGRPTRKADNTDKVPEGRREGGRQRRRERERGTSGLMSSISFATDWFQREK